MAINFPSSPTDGQIFDSGEVTYKYNGTKGYWYAFQYESAPTGFTGSRGYTGSEGVGFTGSRGDTGFTGSQGSIGFTGSQGVQGPGVSTGKAIAMAIVFG